MSRAVTASHRYPRVVSPLLGGTTLAETVPIHMRTSIAIFTIATIASTLAVAGARATPIQVNVRIEGSRETLFEGPIWTEGHDLRASSEDQEHACDGTSAKRYPTPGPTPTAAAADAMGIVGE